MNQTAQYCLSIRRVGASLRGPAQPLTQCMMPYRLESDLLRSQHDELLQRLNQQLLEKADLQIQMRSMKSEIQSSREEIKQSRAEQENLVEEMIQHRRTFNHRKKLLEEQVHMTFLL